MALATGTIAASATPATDLFAQMNTALTGAGWVEEVTRTYTASIMGTTANCRVYTSPSTTVASSIYTGCILSFEIDDTNARIRVRACEKFDSSLSGAAALNTKWAAPGNASGTSQTPTANFALSDSFVSHFQAAGTGQTVGWVEIACSASGFNYWLGANANRVILCNNSAGVPRVCIAGQLAYQGDINTAIGNVTVFILGGVATTSTTGSGSWTMTAAAQEQVRISREPNAVVAQTGYFTAAISGPQALADNGVSGAVHGGPGAGAHRFYQATFVVFPAWFHGGGVTLSMALRSNWATLPEAVVLIVPNVADTLARAAFPNIGELVTVGGTTYTCLNQVQLTGNGAQCGDVALLVDGSQF